MIEFFLPFNLIVLVKKGKTKNQQVLTGNRGASNGGRYDMSNDVSRGCHRNDRIFLCRDTTLGRNDNIFFIRFTKPLIRVHENLVAFCRILYYFRGFSVIGTIVTLGINITVLPITAIIFGEHTRSTTHTET